MRCADCPYEGSPADAGHGRRCRMLPGGASGAPCSAPVMKCVCRLHSMQPVAGGSPQASGTLTRWAAIVLSCPLQPSGRPGSRDSLRVLPSAYESLAPAVATFAYACIEFRRHAHHPLRSTLHPSVTRWARAIRPPPVIRLTVGMPHPQALRTAVGRRVRCLTPRPHYRAVSIVASKYFETHDGTPTAPPAYSARV